MIVQPASLRVTVTLWPLPFELLLLVTEDFPLPDEDTETELLDECDPELCALAEEPPSPASTIVTTTRPSAVWWICLHCSPAGAASAARIRIMPMV